ncbi:MAG: hypothetical protein ACRD1T_10395 [Acidimicrobiia bacterium]
MRRGRALLIVVFGVIAVLATPLAIADTLPAGAEGCVVDGQDASGPSGPLRHATTCTYTSTRNGGYVARGNWTMSVTIGDVTTVYGPANAPAQGCTLWGPGTIVTVTRNDAQSAIAAGNPYPAATDGVLPSRPCA